MCICWGWEDGYKNVYVLRMRRHSILSAPGVFQMENRFSRDLSPEFFGFKKFLTKTLFLLRHSMPLKSEMVWVPLCSTLKPLLLWVTQITLFSIPFLFVTSMKIGSVNRIDKKPLRRLFVFFFLAALKARHPSLEMVFRHHTTTSAYPLDRYQASRCLDYDKAYRRFNSLFLN